MSGFSCGKLEAAIKEQARNLHEMKGDVGMSSHEKERKQEDASTKTQSHL